MSRLKKLPYQKAKEVTDRYDLRPECEPLLRDAPSVADYIARLQEQNLASDLVTFLCYGLPIREAFSWALNCVESTENDWTPDELEALAITRAWLYKPDDTNRRLGDSGRQTLWPQEWSRLAGPGRLLEWRQSDACRRAGGATTRISLCPGFIWRNQSDRYPS